LKFQVPSPRLKLSGNRDADLDRPAGRGDRRGRLPDAVPFAVLAGAVLDQRVVARAARVDDEDVAGAAVLGGIEHDADVILVLEVGIARVGVADDSIRLRIVADDADHDRFGAREHPHLGASGWRRALHRFDHRQIVDGLGRRPCGLFHPAVEAHVLRQHAGAHRWPRRIA